MRRPPAPEVVAPCPPSPPPVAPAAPALSREEYNEQLMSAIKMAFSDGSGVPPVREDTIAGRVERMVDDLVSTL